MSRIRSVNTVPEITLRRLLHSRGLRFRKNVRSLPGCPDIVFVRAEVVVLVNGDFWHGWRFPLWKSKMGPYWQQKIDRNRRRDVRNIRKLRQLGWSVIRVWEHQLKLDPQKCVDRIEAAVRGCRTR